jgi:transposase
MASRAEWEQRVAQWKRSGQTAAVFAVRQGLNPRTLRWWSSALQRPSARESEHVAEVGFARVVPVDIVPGRSAEPAALEVVLASGRVVRVRQGFDAALLRELLTLLETP